MKIFYFVIFLFVSFTSLSQQKKGESIYKTFIFSENGKENFLENEIIQQGLPNDKATIELVLKPMLIGHVNPSPFIAFSCWWAEKQKTNTNSFIFIRYATNKIDWSNWQKIEIDEHNVNKNKKSYSTLNYIDKDLKYYQIKIETNLDGKGEKIKQLFLNFFNPDKVIGRLNNVEATQAEPDHTESCPCPQPTFVSRTQWNCPQGQGMAPGVVTNPSVTHLIVHHSAGPNTAANWNAVVLSIWNFHTGTSGYSDIGYNWLVAPDGTLYEGRGSNSPTANVQGAHFCGFNQASMGTCMIGTYNTVDVTLLARNKLTQILAWKSCQAGIPAIGTAFHASSGITLNRISGHRDGCATDCPGTTFYGSLPQLRIDVDAYVTACNVVPPCTASLNISQAGCPSSTISFTPTNVTNGGSAPTYAWYVNNVFTQNGNTFTLANATNTTKVYARMTSNAACNPAPTNSDTITISCIVPPPPCTASLNISQAGCPNNTISFTPTNITNGGATPTYAWYVNNVFTQNGNTFTLANATNTTKVYARMTSNAACNPAPTNSDTITISCIVPPPPCTASLNISQAGCPNNTISFTPTNVTNGGAAPTYAWYVNNVFTQNGNTFTLANATNATKVYARMTSNAACNPAPTNSDTITLSCIVIPVNPIITPEYCTISPNPNNGNFSVKIKRNQPTVVQYRLIDAVGKQVILTNKETINGVVNKNFTQRKLANGVYTLEIYFDEKKITKQIFVAN